MRAQGQAFLLDAQRDSLGRVFAYAEKALCHKEFSSMTPLDDGIYDVVIIDVDEAFRGACEQSRARAVSLEVLITSGVRKGDVVALQRARGGSELDLLGLPATLTVINGTPRLDFD
jgi:hypothetical protein